jgi:hypothetical protein
MRRVAARVALVLWLLAAVVTWNTVFDARIDVVAVLRRRGRSSGAVQKQG